MSPNSVSAEIHLNSFYHVVVKVSIVQSDQSNLLCIQPAIRVICHQVIGTAVYYRHIISHHIISLLQSTVLHRAV